MPSLMENQPYVEDLRSRAEKGDQAAIDGLANLALDILFACEEAHTVLSSIDRVPDGPIGDPEDRLVFQFQAVDDIDIKITFNHQTREYALSVEEDGKSKTLTTKSLVEALSSATYFLKELETEDGYIPGAFAS